MISQFQVAFIWFDVEDTQSAAEGLDVDREQVRVIAVVVEPNTVVRREEVRATGEAERGVGLREVQPVSQRGERARRGGARGAGEEPAGAPSEEPLGVGDKVHFRDPRTGGRALGTRMRRLGIFLGK